MPAPPDAPPPRPTDPPPRPSPWAGALLGGLAPWVAAGLFGRWLLSGLDPSWRATAALYLGAWSAPVLVPVLLGLTLIGAFAGARLARWIGAAGEGLPPAP